MEVLLFIIGLVMAVLAIVCVVTAFECNDFGVAFLAIICLFFSMVVFIGAIDCKNDKWICCNETIYSDHCPECGKARPVKECNEWTCCDHKHENDVKHCPYCGKARPENGSSNNIVVKDNEEVNIYVNDDGEVVIDNEWTCCNNKITSKFCPECGKQKNNTEFEPEIIIEKNGVTAVYKYNN